MKNITEILNEAYTYSDDWMKAVSNKLNNRIETLVKIKDIDILIKTVNLIQIK